MTTWEDVLKAREETRQSMFKAQSACYKTEVDYICPWPDYPAEWDKEAGTALDEHVKRVFDVHESEPSYEQAWHAGIRWCLHKMSERALHGVQGRPGEREDMEGEMKVISEPLPGDRS